MVCPMSSVPDLLQPIDENSQQKEENHSVVPNAVSTSKKIKRKKINIKRTSPFHFLRLKVEEPMRLAEDTLSNTLLASNQEA